MLDVLFTAPLSAEPLAESGFLAAVSYRCNYEYDCSVNRIDLYCQSCMHNKTVEYVPGLPGVFSFWSLWVTVIPPRSRGPEDPESAGLFTVFARRERLIADDGFAALSESVL